MVTAAWAGEDISGKNETEANARKPKAIDTKRLILGWNNRLDRNFRYPKTLDWVECIDNGKLLPEEFFW